MSTFEIGTKVVKKVKQSNGIELRIFGEIEDFDGYSESGKCIVWIQVSKWQWHEDSEMIKESIFKDYMSSIQFLDELEKV